MIGRIGKLLGIVVVLVLLGTQVGEPFVRAQNGFRDDASDIPPSPSAPFRSPSIAVGTSAPAMASPPRMTSPPQASPTKLSTAYNLTRLPMLPQGRGRTTAMPSETPSPGIPAHSTFGTVGRYGVGKTTAAQTGVGPYGIGKIGTRPPGVASSDTGRLPTADRMAAGSPPYVTPLGKLPTSGVIRPTVHSDHTVDPGFMDPMTPPTDPSGLPPLFPRLRSPLPGNGSAHPSERAVPPTILGSHLGLQPGETATERSLRLMSAVGELEAQVDTLAERNVDLIQHIKQRDEQLLLAIREIRSARKEVASARDELERLRQQVKGLQGKVGDAERENAALLQTMAPLLHKLLEPDGTGSGPDGRQE